METVSLSSPPINPDEGAIFDFESEGTYEEDPSEEVLRRAVASGAELRRPAQVTGVRLRNPPEL